jgi:hypothetical protein
MTQEETLEYNKRCTEFLGYINTTPTDKDFDIYHNEKGMIIGNKIYTMIEPMSAKFHSDWNWIHEVVDNIKNTTNPKNHSDTTFSTLRREIQIHLGTSNKKAVVQTINQFLIWYNANKI